MATNSTGKVTEQIQVRKDKRPVQIISTSITVVTTGRKDRKTNAEIKKPEAVVQ